MVGVLGRGAIVRTHFLSVELEKYTSRERWCTPKKFEVNAATGISGKLSRPF